MKKDDRGRCSWATTDFYKEYHDKEWCVPEYHDPMLFELLILESFQAGLSWECVLNKREAFREAFDQFDLDKVCGYKEEKVQALMDNKEIIRNRRKITAAIGNARIFRQIQAEWGTFSDYIWHFTEKKIVYENDKTSSELSDKVSADLKKRGMKFVGTTIIYSYLQAIGVIYSHEDQCFLFDRKLRMKNSASRIAAE